MTALSDARGQTRHSALYRDPERRDDSCEGVIRAAYVRKLTEGQQRWVRVGEHCDGCGSFWPGAKRPSMRRVLSQESHERALVMQARERDPRRVKRYAAGRNDPCPCGSGLKFKRCHGA
jgi:hypothetical protein